MAEDAKKQLNNGEAEEALNTAKSAADKAKDQKKEALARAAQVDALVALSRADEAVSVAADAVAVGKKSGDSEAECAALNASVGAHLLKDATTAALKAANNALALAQQSGDKSSEAQAWLGIARIHLSSDDSDQAALLDCLQGAEKATDIFKNAKNEEGEAAARGVIASAQLKLGNAEEAVQAANASYKIWRDADAAKRTNDALALLVQAFAANGNAREGMRQARAELDGISNKDRRRLAGALLVVCEAAMTVNDNAEAFRCAKQARATYRALDDATGEAWSTYWCGVSQQAMGQKLEAMKSAEEAIGMFKGGSADGMAATNSLLSELYLSIGKGSKAPDRKKLLLVLRDLNKAVENKDVEAFNKARNKAETFSKFLEEYDTMDALAPAFDKDPQGTAEFLREQGWTVEEGGSGEKKAQQMRHFDHQSYYAYFRTVGGMGFGPQFRSTHPYRVGTPGVDAVAMSATCLPETEDWEMKMGFRPGIIDSGLQCGAVLGFP